MELLQEVGDQGLSSAQDEAMRHKHGVNQMIA